MKKKPVFKKHKLNISFKQLLIAGLLVWLPIIVTIWAISYIVSVTDILLNLIPNQYRPEQLIGYNIPGLGLLLTIIILFVTGIFAANVLGRKIINLSDTIIGKIPFIKSVYNGVKKVSQSILSESRDSFKDPILVQFPHPDAWAIGFISGIVPKNIADQLDDGEEYISVYVPTTPNPTGGYFIFVKKSATRKIDLTVDEAFKYIISFGIMNKEDK